MLQQINITHFPKLTELHLINMNTLKYVATTKVLDFSTITALTIIECDIYERLLVNIIQKCNKLEKFSLLGSNIKSTTHTDETSKHTLIHSEQLMNKYITDVLLDNPNLSDVCFDSTVTNKTLQIMLENCRNITNITILYNTRQKINADILHSIASNYQKLRCFNLGKCNSVTHEIILTLLQHNHSTLETFINKENKYITDESIIPFVTLCKQLKVIELSHTEDGEYSTSKSAPCNMTVNILYSLLDNCKQIEVFKCRTLFDTTADAIKAIEIQKKRSYANYDFSDDEYDESEDEQVCLVNVCMYACVCVNVCGVYVVVLCAVW